MPHYTYLIVGGGMTADAAIGGIREVDPSGSVGLIGADPHPPYDRPPLSKGLWKGKPLESIWRKTDRQGVTLHLGRQATSTGPAEQASHRRSGDGLHLRQAAPRHRRHAAPAALRRRRHHLLTAPWTITSGCER